MSEQVIEVEELENEGGAFDQEVTEEEPTDLLTPYKAAGHVNHWLAADKVPSRKGDGKWKRIPRQMLYNYTTGAVRKGKEPVIPLHSGKVSLGEVAAWYEGYRDKLLGV
jgi:hypothetical protein